MIPGRRTCQSSLAVWMIVMVGASNSGTLQAASLRAGVARVDITPAPGAAMWGYSSRTSPGQGTLDPLYAKALVLSDGKASVALVCLDLGRTFEDDQLERIRVAAAKAGIQTVLVAATHTHHAPSVEIRMWPSKDEAWVDQAVEKVIRAVNEAASRLADATIAVGWGQVDQGHNRRHITPDGRVQMRWRNAKRDPTQPVDKSLGVLRIDDTTGKPVAILVNYACHPVVLGPDNVQYSADYVGVMSKTVEAKSGAQCMFLQGACGDINPYVDKTPLTKDGVKHMAEMGRVCAQEVLRVAGDLRPALAETPSVKVKTSRFRLNPRWDFSDPEVKKQILDRYREYIERLGEAAVLTYFDRFHDPVDVISTTVLLNDSVAWVGFPGEFFVDFQLDLRQRSPVPNTIFIGYADGYYAYFPTIRAAAEGGYGAGYQTFVEVGAGERIVDQAIINLYQLLGRFTRGPARDVPNYPGQTDN